MLLAKKWKRYLDGAPVKLLEMLCLKCEWTVPDVGEGGWLNIKQQQISPQIFLWYCFLALKGLLNRQAVQFSCSVMSDSLRPHGLQYARLPRPSPIPEAYSNSCPLSWWCHPTISSTVVSSSRLQSFQVSGFFQMSWLFISSGQSIGVSASALNECSGLISFRMDWLDLLAVQGTLKNLHSSKASILWCSAFFIVQLSHPYMTNGKAKAWLNGSLLAK